MVVKRYIPKNGDYVSGKEMQGMSVVDMKGWVNNVREQDGYMRVFIQCDDRYGGYRCGVLIEEYGDVNYIDRRDRPDIT